MTLLNRYSSSTFLALIAGTALVAAHAIYVDASVGGAATAIWSALRDIPQTMALLFPLATFAGGVSAAHAAPTRRQTFLLAFGASLIALLVAGFLAPWISQAIAFAGQPRSPTFSAHTLFEWRAEYVSLLAQRANGEPVLAWMTSAAGLGFYQPFVAAVLAPLFTIVGVLVGERTSAMMDLRVARAHHWGAGLLTILCVVASASFAATISIEHGVSPGLSLLLVPVAPSALALSLLWADAVERDPRDRVASIELK